MQYAFSLLLPTARQILDPVIGRAIAFGCDNANPCRWGATPCIAVLERKTWAADTPIDRFSFVDAYKQGSEETAQCFKSLELALRSAGHELTNVNVAGPASLSDKSRAYTLALFRAAQSLNISFLAICTAAELTDAAIADVAPLLAAAASDGSFKLRVSIDHMMPEEGKANLLNSNGHVQGSVGKTWGNLLRLEEAVLKSGHDALDRLKKYTRENELRSAAAFNRNVQFSLVVTPEAVDMQRVQAAIRCIAAMFNPKIANNPRNSAEYIRILIGPAIGEDPDDGHLKPDAGFFAPEFNATSFLERLLSAAEDRARLLISFENMTHPADYELKAALTDAIIARRKKNKHLFLEETPGFTDNQIGFARGGQAGESICIRVMTDGHAYPLHVEEATEEGFQKLFERASICHPLISDVMLASRAGLFTRRQVFDGTAPT